MPRLVVLALCLAAAASCELRPRPAPSPQSVPSAAPAPVPTAPSAAFARAGGTPRLVVLIVIDQLADWALDRHLPRLAPQGLLRRAIADGRRLRAELPYAVSLTAPGHATIATGTLPSEHGIYGNGLWSAARKARITIVDDGEHAVLGRDDAFAGPGMLRRTTIADALRASSQGRARVVSLSLKERAAVLLGGQRPEAAVWYDKKTKGFTTSSHYGALPSWVGAYQAAHPIDALLVPWRADDPAGLEAAYGPDDAPGESTTEGFGRAFPHDPSATKDPWGLLRATPQLGEYLIALAGEAASAEGLGTDEAPDLLALSVSTVDYAGHYFGPTSWEYAEALRRIDLALGAMVDGLAEKGPIAVVVTSDHGVAPLPESSEAKAGAGADGTGRLGPAVLTDELEAALDRRLGRGDWIAAIVEPFVYLGPDGEKRRRAAIAEVVALLGGRPGVAIAAEVAVARGWTEDADPIKRLVAASLPEGMEADVVLVPGAQWSFDIEEPPGTGADHGTPWPYDREVPLIIAGAGVARAAGTETVDARRIAPTVAALLGVPASSRPGEHQPIVNAPDPADRANHR